MPLYEYECPECGLFELRRSFADETLKNCPTCGEGIRQILHPAGLVFKGPGFYSTDNKGDTRVRGESGQLGQLVSETDLNNIDDHSPQKSDPSGKPRTTPTRPGPRSIEHQKRRT